MEKTKETMVVVDDENLKIKIRFFIKLFPSCQKKNKIENFVDGTEAEKVIADSLESNTRMVTEFIDGDDSDFESISQREEIHVRKHERFDY